MDWIDESRRLAFTKSELARAKSTARASAVFGELDRLLPHGSRARALEIGNELILSYEDAVAAVQLASRNSIAVLGFEAGEVVPDGFQVVDYSGYELEVVLKPDWNAYVEAMNSRAQEWMKAHHYGHNHGYILSATSEREFRELPSRIR